MNQSARILVSVLNWNGGSQSLDCLRALYTSTYSAFDVLVIDNASTDGSCERIEAAFPHVRLIRNSQNEGFAEGHNRAMQLCLDEGYEAIWILNSDVQVATETLEVLVGELREHQGMAMLSPVLYYASAPDDIQFCGGQIDWDRRCIHNFPAAKFHSTGGNIEMGSHPFLWGTALLIGRAVLEKIGFFDPRFFAYFEDTDFSVRAQQCGIDQRVASSAKIYHGSPISMWNRPPHFFYLMTRNEMLFWAKHLSRQQKQRFTPRFIGDSLARAARCEELGHTLQRDACLLGMIDGLKARNGAFDLSRRLPGWVTKMLMWHPYFFRRLLARAS